MNKYDDKTAEPMAPYCGGCGHRFFGEPYVLPSEAREKAKTRRCLYCIEDAAEDEKQRKK
jgi:hypothetical protein